MMQNKVHDNRDGSFGDDLQYNVNCKNGIMHSAGKQTCRVNLKDANEWGVQCVAAQDATSTTVTAVFYWEDINCVFSLQFSSSGLRLMGGGRARDISRIV